MSVREEMKSAILWDKSEMAVGIYSSLFEKDRPYAIIPMEEKGY